MANGPDQAPEASGPVTWRDYPGEGVVVHAAEGSYAGKDAAAELEQAERAMKALEELLEPGDRTDPPIDVYLVDPAAHGAGDEPPPELGEEAHGGDAIGEGGIVRVVRSEEPPEPIAVPIARFAVGRWFGPKAAASE